ncbi:hypothetical protein F5X99DRAFT_12385 [Biscogniauxia marginata]|nr:hypothetical protein F5X99DRAFT_12385 [Biscogniauxia marginata]
MMSFSTLAFSPSLPSIITAAFSRLDTSCYFLTTLSHQTFGLGLGMTTLPAVDILFTLRRKPISPTLRGTPYLLRWSMAGDVSSL